MRTDQNLQTICDALQQNCGDIHAAARAASVSPQFVMRWIKDDKAAADAIDEAQRVGWMGLESEAIRRATVGVDKGVYYKGEIVGYETLYSDTLLTKVMEARIPEYRKGEGALNQFNGPTQINIMPRAENYEQWLEMKKLSLAARAQELLPAPIDVPEILQGTYVEVEPVNILEGLL